MRRRRRKRRGKRRRGSKLQCKLPQQCSTVVLVTKAIVFSPVNKKEEKEMEDKETEEEENKRQKEEDEIRTTMQSSIAMLQSCIHGPKQLFLSSKRGSGGGGDHSYNAVFRSNAAEL